jgi:hypothetical protein
MKFVRWTLLSAALIVLGAAAIVKAQTDDLFGAPEANPTSDARPAAATQEDDLFGPAPAADPANQKASNRASEGDPFGPAAARPASPPMRNVPSAPGAAQADTDNMQDNLCKWEGELNQAAIARIESALSSPLHRSGLDFADTPLAEVVEQLQQEYEIPIHIDAKALDEIGVGTDEPVTLNLQGISLRSALRLMLKQHQMTYIIDDEVLLITTPEESDSRIKVCVYDVRDLVGSNPASTLKQLSEVVTSCVSPESWNGGGGSIRSYPPNLLVISQPQAVHAEINSLLKRMRQMRQQ